MALRTQWAGVVQLARDIRRIGVGRWARWAGLGRWVRWARWMSLALAAAGLMTAYVLALWKMPDTMNLTEPRDRYSARLLVVSVGGGAVVLVGLLYTARSYRLTRRGQVTDRFIKALECLSSDQLYVRFGGVQMLEQIIHDAPDQATNAVELLAVFIREHAPRPSASPPPTLLRQVARRLVPARVQQSSLPDPEDPEMRTMQGRFKPPHLLVEDVQAALSVVTDPAIRRHVDFGVGLDLRQLNLQHARLPDADLTWLWLGETNLAWAGFGDANLAGTDFKEANLSHTVFARAKLTEADLSKADLTNAFLLRADLTEADLTGANLTHAKLWVTDLTRAKLWGANLTEADLRQANLLEAEGLTVAQLVAARPTSTTRLPADLAAEPAVQARINEVENSR
jgi:uncharacterized protein YjbI with pentapeptide repeats